MLNLRGIREIRGVRELYHCAVRLIDAVHDAGRRRHEIQIILALQSLLNNFEVQESEETAAETEAERERGLRLVGQRRIV